MAFHVCAKIRPHFGKKNGRHSQLFENHKDALKLEILQLALSNFYKRYMARKARVLVILAKFQKQNGHHITCLMSSGIIQLKRSYFCLNIAPRGSECKKHV